MTSDRIRIGVIGLEFGARVHIPAFQSEGMEVAAVCARHEEKAREVANQYGVRDVFTDYQEMVRMGDIQAVSVAGPVALHHKMTMAALEAGKHVLCEKPFTTDQGLAKEMWKKAEGAGLTAMIAHEFRFASARRRVKQLLEVGYLGPLHMALMRLVSGPVSGFQARPLTDRDDATLGNGFIWGLGSHYIDCLRDWFGEIETVWGHLDTHFGERIHPDTAEIVQATADDTFHFVLRFVEGGWAAMTGTTAARFGPGGGVELYGRDGALVTPHEGRGFNPPAHGTLLGAKTGEEKLIELPIPDHLEPFSDDRDDRLMPFRLLVREFLRGIKEGSSPSPNFYDGFRCQQVIDAVRLAAATGQLIHIGEGG